MPALTTSQAKVSSITELVNTAAKALHASMALAQFTKNVRWHTLIAQAPHNQPVHEELKHLLVNFLDACRELIFAQKGDHALEHLIDLAPGKEREWARITATSATHWVCKLLVGIATSITNAAQIGEISIHTNQVQYYSECLIARWDSIGPVLAAIQLPDVHHIQEVLEWEAHQAMSRIRRTAPDSGKEGDQLSSPNSASVAKESAEENAMLSPRDLADLHKVPYHQLRKRLQTWRNNNLGSINQDWIEATDRRKNMPAYLYRVKAIKHIIDNLKDKNVQRMSSKK